MEKIKQGYKQTDIGVIPEDWEVKPIGKTLKIKHGKDQKKVLSIDGKYPILGTGGLMGYATIFLYNQESVLIGRKGTINKPMFMDKPFWTVDTLFYSEIKKGYLPKFIYYKFQMIDWYAYNEASGVPSLNAKTIEKIDISTPKNISEQTTIATVLSDTDALIAALDKKIAKKQQIKQGAMQQLLTGKKRLPGFSGEWVEKTIWEIAEKNKNRLNDGDWIECAYITNEGIRLVQTGNIGIGWFKDKSEKRFISVESFDKLNCKEVLQNDILICRLAEPAGRTCLAPKSSTKMITSVDVSIFRPNEIFYDRAFLLYVLNTPEWFSEINDRCGGSTRTRIARMQLGSISIKIPQTKSEQTAIAQILTDMDHEIAQLEKERDKYKELKAGMMQVLLTGKVRLV